MGHRTLTLGLLFRALFLDSDAFEELRDDDNPFVEGLFLVALLAMVTALLTLIGQVLAWAGTPRLDAVQQAALDALQRQPWLGAWLASTGAAEFQRWWDTAWRLLPGLIGALDPATSALNILVWPLWAVASWLLYGCLAHLFARMLGGTGSLNQTLGTTALAFTPWLLRGLGFIPFLVIGGGINTWQLILRYKALRTAHGLAWGRALWATLLPFAVYALFWLPLAAAGVAAVAAIAGR